MRCVQPRPSLRAFGLGGQQLSAEPGKAVCTSHVVGGKGIRFSGLGCHHEAIQRHRPTCWPITAISLEGQS